MKYEILFTRDGELREFTPPLKVASLDSVRLIAPIIQRQFGPAVVLDEDGNDVPWKAAAVARG